MTDYIDLVYLRALNDRHVSEAADAIEHLQRELKCSKEMWEQQQELALEYLADIEKANERIAELEQEIDDYETIYKGSVVEAQAKRIAEIEDAYVRLSDKELRQRQTLDDVWQDLHIVLGHVRSAIRERKQ